MVCQLTPAQEARMYEILRGIADDPHALEMQQFIQHGTVTTYEHCLRVTRIAYWPQPGTGIAMPMKSAWCAARFCTIFICTIGTTVPTSPTGTALSTP